MQDPSTAPYQVLYLPNEWPEGVSPHWIVGLVTDEPLEALVHADGRVNELRACGVPQEQAEMRVLITQSIHVQVVVTPVTSKN